MQEASEKAQRTTVVIITQLVLLSIFLSCLLGSSALAQQPGEDEEETKPATLPPGVPVIPAPSDRDKVLLITSQNEVSFEDILIAPLAAWLKDGRLAMRIVRNLDFNWRYSAAWEDTSRRNMLEYDLDNDFSLTLRQGDTPNEGAPFGLAEEINQESDAVRKAYKILWSAAYIEGIARDVYYQTEFSWIGSQSVLRTARGGFYRRTYFAPPAVKVASSAASSSSSSAAQESSSAPAPAPELGFNGPKDIFRQEVLRMFSPPVISQLTFATTRFRGAQPDDLWTYSPLLKRVRPLLPANRTDALLGGNFTLDDFFVWPEKIQAVNARVVDEKVLLVAFPAVNYYKVELGSFSEQPQAALAGLPQRTELQAGSGLPPAAKASDEKGENVATVHGFHQRPDGSQAMVLWNYQSRQLPQLAPWVPTTATFVPRRVWIIELTPKNPYTAFGREIVMVDEETLLPVYKLVYDRIGEYRETVIGAWGLARTKDGKSRFPFNAFVLAIDQSMQSVNAVTTELVQTFGGKDIRGAQVVRNWLDLDKYPKAEKKKQDEGGGEPAEPPPTND